MYITIAQISDIAQGMLDGLRHKPNADYKFFSHQDLLTYDKGYVQAISDIKAEIIKLINQHDNACS